MAGSRNRSQDQIGDLNAVSWSDSNPFETRNLKSFSELQAANERQRRTIFSDLVFVFAKILKSKRVRKFGQKEDDRSASYAISKSRESPNATVKNRSDQLILTSLLQA